MNQLPPKGILCPILNQGVMNETYFSVRVISLISFRLLVQFLMRCVDVLRQRDILDNGHVRTIACSNMYRDAVAAIFNQSASNLHVLVEKKNSYISPAPFPSKVNMLVLRRFFHFTVSHLNLGLNPAGEMIV